MIQPWVILSSLIWLLLIPFIPNHSVLVGHPLWQIHPWLLHTSLDTIRTRNRWRRLVDSLRLQLRRPIAARIRTYSIILSAGMTLGPKLYLFTALWNISVVPPLSWLLRFHIPNKIRTPHSILLSTAMIPRPRLQHLIAPGITSRVPPLPCLLLLDRYNLSRGLHAQKSFPQEP